MSGLPINAASLPPRSISINQDMHSLGSVQPSPSPLKLFGNAKQKVNDTFKEVIVYINETEKFLRVVTGGVVTEQHMAAVAGFKQKSEGIAEVLARNHMKVVFFGRTSNGKSTVINAMLGTKLLPTGIGHTTNCFLQVEGSSQPRDEDAYILTEDSDEPKSVQSLKQLASALSSLKVSCNSLIKIFWPKTKCQLLREDLVLLDSPGIGVDDDLDGWIDKFCLDADVFVLVSNAESTLMQTEKNFFHKVSEKLSEPSIFILNNRWDASAMEPEDMEEVKAQHMDRAVKFLAEELRVMSKHDAEERVFFVSAREALIQRFNQEQGSSTPIGQLMEGFQVRMFDFCNFERKFEECISKSAVKTKFAKHAERGLHMVGELRRMMDEIFVTTRQKRLSCESKYREETDRLDYIDKQLTLISSEIKEKISQMVQNVENKVSTVLNDEIRRLSVLVDEFDRPFHPDPNIIAVYKKELHHYIEQGLGRILQSRCSAAVILTVDHAEKDMTERLSALLPNDERQQQEFDHVNPHKDFEVAYRLDCTNLCGDFREDIEFRFSLGITSLVQRFLGPKNAMTALRGYSDEIPRPITPADGGHSAAVAGGSRDPGVSDDVTLMMITTFASLTSRSTVGTVIVAGLVLKSAGWRILAAVSCLYGLIYLYERMTWTNKARERAFKQQYVNYASSKLRLIVNMTSGNCSQQVQQQLSGVFARLRAHVERAKDELRQDIRSLEREAGSLEMNSKQAKILRNKADWLTSELEAFVHEYLKDAHM